MSVQSKEIGSHVFIVRPFNGARAEAAVRVLMVDLHRIFTSRLGLQDEAVARSVNKDALAKIQEALVCPDHMTVRMDGEGPERAMTEAVWEDTVPANQRLAVIAFAGMVNFCPELLPQAA